MARPSLNLQTLREKFPPHIFERGGRYQQSGEVLDLTLRGRTVLAGVQGSDDEPYRVTLELSEDDLLRATCSCPYEDNFGGWCKHIAAVALEYIHRPDMVITEPSVAELLSPLDAATLRGALSHLLELYPEATSKLELYLQKTALREASVGAAGPPRSGRNSRRSTRHARHPLVREDDAKRGARRTSRLGRVSRI